jgi:ribokinase
VGPAEDVRCAVVGHVEWVEFAHVDAVPRPGEIIHAKETWTQAAGGGAVAALQLQNMCGDVTFFTALGDDELGHSVEQELGAAGIRMEAVFRAEPQRRAFVFLDSNGERTITTINAKLGPHAADPLAWNELDRIDGVYFTGGDPSALREARRARALVATARELPTLKEAGVRLDAVVHSGIDAGEPYRPGDLEPPPRLVVTTEGAEGGSYLEGDREGRWAAAPLPGPLVDTYGAGDSFAAGLAYGLGAGLPTEDALAVAARAAAEAMTVPGAAFSR